MKTIKNILAIFLPVLLLVSCSKWDDYKQYTNAGETLYTGKMDSVKIYPGRLRVRIVGLLPADPKIVKTKITWNSGNDSVVYAITKGTGIDSFIRTLAVPEGITNFSIQNFDAQGNKSMLVTATGVAYGPKYESGLLNRPIVSADLLVSNSSRITWGSADTSSGAKGTWARFTKADNSMDSIYTPAGSGSTTLANAKAGTTVTYRTVYQPTSTAIDSFNSAVNSIADVTSIYLGNTGRNFQRAAFDGRWGTLAAPWITNAAAKNKGGQYGGYSADEGGVINWETWGSTPVVNGIIYQATAIPLPAGQYTVSFDEYSEIQANSTVFCVAAAGGNGIPVLANLSTALGSVGLYNGAPVGQTSPSLSDTRSFSFRIATPQVVSIGFLGNIAGSGNPGSYFQVKRIQLFSN